MDMYKDNMRPFQLQSSSSGFNAQSRRRHFLSENSLPAYPAVAKLMDWAAESKEELAAPIACVKLPRGEAFWSLTLKPSYSPGVATALLIFVMVAESTCSGLALQSCRASRRSNA